MKKKLTYQELEQRNLMLEEKITKLEKNGNALCESERRYRCVFENANEAIFIVQDMKIVFANPSVSALSGYSAEEIMSWPFFEFIHPDDQGMVRDRHAKRLQGEMLLDRYDFRIIHKDGRVRWFQLNAVLLIWEERPATLNFINDITDHKRAEMERDQLISELQKAISEVKTLSGLLPICSSCKKIRTDQGYWEQLEKYIKKHSEAEFSHGLCPECAANLYPDFFKRKL